MQEAVDGVITIALPRTPRLTAAPYIAVILLALLVCSLGVFSPFFRLRALRLSQPAAFRRGATQIAVDDHPIFRGNLRQRRGHAYRYIPILSIAEIGMYRYPCGN